MSTCGCGGELKESRQLLATSHNNFTKKRIFCKCQYATITCEGCDIYCLFSDACKNAMFNCDDCYFDCTEQACDRATLVIHKSTLNKRILCAQRWSCRWMTILMDGKDAFVQVSCRRPSSSRGACGQMAHSG